MINGSGNGRAVTTDEKAVPTSGRSRSVVRMTVHTRDTQKLISGRPAADGKPAIIGLFGFAERLRIIWDAARSADPFACWWLLRVEDAYASTVSKIELERAAIHNELRPALDFDIELGSSEPTCQIELNFACPYAYWGAKVLKIYDELVLAAATAERLGLRRRSHRASNRFRCERAIRGLFASALGYRALGVTPGDIKNGSSLAAEARVVMGEIPTTVLDGNRKPTLLIVREPVIATSEAKPS